MRTALKMLSLRRRSPVIIWEEDTLLTETAESSETEPLGASDTASVCTCIDHGPEEPKLSKYNVKRLGRKFLERVKKLWSSGSMGCETVKGSSEVRRDRLTTLILKVCYAVCLALSIVILAGLAFVIVVGLCGAIAF